MPDMAPGMQLLVQTDDGKSTRVQDWAGVVYGATMDLNVKENTHIQVTIAQAEIEGHQWYSWHVRSAV